MLSEIRTGLGILVNFPQLAAPAAYLNKKMHRSTLVVRLFKVFTFVYAFWLLKR